MEPEVCPAILSPLLDNPLRRFIHNPERILNGLIKEGDTAIDIGCGPGVFTMTMANMVGMKGTVIAVDMQNEMLDAVRKKAAKYHLDSQVQMQKCQADSLCVKTSADFILTFYMVHEVDNKEHFFDQVTALLKKDGTYLLVEPKIHVKKSAFENEIEIAKRNGLKIKEYRKILFSRAVLFTK